MRPGCMALHGIRAGPRRRHECGQCSQAKTENAFDGKRSWDTQGSDHAGNSRTKRECVMGIRPDFVMRRASPADLASMNKSRECFVGLGVLRTIQERPHRSPYGGNKDIFGNIAAPRLREMAGTGCRPSSLSSERKPEPVLSGQSSPCSFKTWSTLSLVICIVSSVTVFGTFSPLRCAMACLRPSAPGVA